MAAKKTTGPLEIPPIVMRSLEVHVVGTMPLLQNAWVNPEAAFPDEERPTTTVKSARDPEEWIKRAHVIDADAGQYGMPASGIKKSLVVAGGRFADAVQAKLRGAIHIHTPTGLVPLVTAAGNPVSPFRRVDMAVVGRGQACPARRPQFDDWEARVPVTFLKNEVSEEFIFMLFRLAGITVGWGPWRPERGGVFGTFKLGDKHRDLGEERL